LFIFLTGHGGDKYMKIQYLEIFFSRHFSDSMEDAYVRDRYKQVFAIADTCSAGTLFYTTSAKRGIFWGSSGWDEYSLSEGFDKYIGQPLKDRFSYRFQKWIWNLGTQKQFTFDDFNSKDVCNNLV
jgi:phosphatidylinositol glycan class K